MDWQQVVALGIVGITASVFLVVRLRRKRLGFPCGGDCGCATSGPGTFPPQVIYRARKGEPPQVILQVIQAPSRRASLPKSGR